MRRHIFVPAMSLLLAGSLSACGSATPPLTAPALATAALPHDSGIIGAFTVRIDPAALTAEVSPIRTSLAQPPQAISYQIEIGPFVSKTDFRITDVRRGLGGDLELVWRHAHPFPAPDVSKPITAKNRADLGYTGYVVMVDEAAGASYFGSSVTLAQSLAKSADAWIPLGDLFAPNHPTSRLFPAWLLVDEALDSRVGVSNGGNPAGNYTFTTGGWQRDNLGANGDGWTGYDYLHGGQATTGVITLVAPGRGAAPMNLTLALLAKWTDPRGVGGPSMRLPPEPTDALTFAYRLPFSALDASQIIAPAVIEVDRAAGSSTHVSLAIRDWDALFGEASDADLSDETSVQLIQPGASGTPVVRVDLPGSGAGPFTFTFAKGLGIPTQELRYTADIVHPGALPAGGSWGLIEVIDPEDADPAAVNYRLGVTPGTLVAHHELALPIRTYQPVRWVASDSSRELLFATAATSLSASASTSLVQLLPGPATIVPGSQGTLYGTAMADFMSPLASELLIVSPAGQLTSLDRSPGGLRTARPHQEAAYLHPSAAQTTFPLNNSMMPFLALEAGNPIQLGIGDFLTGQRIQTYTNLPAAMPTLNAQGQEIFSDLAGPDWRPGSPTQAVVALGTGLKFAVALPPLTANGNLYTFDPSNPSTTFTKLTTIGSSSTSQGVFYPDWSLDGTKIVCVHVTVNILNLAGSFKIGVVNTSSGAITDLNLSAMGAPPPPATAYIPIQPVYNRDGTKIAFTALEVNLTSQQVSDADIWIYDSTGPTITNISNTNNIIEGYPVFR